MEALSYEGMIDGDKKEGLGAYQMFGEVKKERGGNKRREKEKLKAARKSTCVYFNFSY